MIWFCLVCVSLSALAAHIRIDELTKALEELRNQTHGDGRSR